MIIYVDISILMIRIFKKIAYSPQSYCYKQLRWSGIYAMLLY